MDELILGLKTAFLDQTTQSNLAFRPEFLSNNPAAGEKVLSALEQELSNCAEFQISVAFITVGGITPLLQVLKELETKGIPGRILTTDYLSFTDPRALDTLSGLNNIALRIYHCDEDALGFHTKGYIFRNEEIYRIIIGSANMTLSAITTNHEWNTKIVSHKNGEIARCVLAEFEQLWTSPHTFEYSDFIDSYRILFQREQIIRQQQELARYERIADIESYTLKPNKMQERFVANVLDMYSNNMDRALLLSSTGTGKTYASAFAMRELHPAKALFVVHREQIAKQAMKSYRKVFGTSTHYGLLSGSHRDLNADFLFSTMQMMAKREIYTQFEKDEFDIIVLDECHHAGSESYQRILNYFTPKFWLGMTASPDTNNYDIYSIFDHNIAYEIRLQQALEEDLLCPFHYFGITDLEINGQVFDDNAGVRNFANLVCDARVDYVIEKANYYGYSGERVKGVIFCSRKDEARELCLKFNQRGYRSVVLTGEDSQEERESAIERLATETDPSKQLDYIFTVDIFNEGVDIPEINQVIMLRPTQSPVVFIQQ